MNTRTLLTLGGVTIAALAAVYAIGLTQCRRNQKKRNVDDIARWEDEGGPAHPDENVTPPTSPGVA